MAEQPTLAQQAARLPEAPGVYLFKDAHGRILYIGKARDLRARVHQYLRGHDQRPMVPQLVAAAASVEVIPVHGEREALLLESALIQEHRPRFNSQFKNDSGFLYIELDLASPWPRPLLVRVDPRREQKARQKERRDPREPLLRFGPWHASWEASRLLDLVQRHFPLRTCTDAVLQSRRRPCLLHQMHRCAAPCTRVCAGE